MQNMLGYKDIVSQGKYSNVHGWMDSMRMLHAVNVTSIPTEKFEAFMKTYAADKPQYDM